MRCGRILSLALAVADVTRVLSGSTLRACDNDKFISIIKFLYLFKLRFNFICACDSHNVPHYDLDYSFFALARYINSTDGYLFAWHTIIYNQRLE